MAVMPDYPEFDAWTYRIGVTHSGLPMLRHSLCGWERPLSLSESSVSNLVGLSSIHDKGCSFSRQRPEATVGALPPSSVQKAIDEAGIPDPTDWESVRMAREFYGNSGVH